MYCLECGGDALAKFRLEVGGIVTVDRKLLIKFVFALFRKITTPGMLQLNIIAKNNV